MKKGKVFGKRSVVFSALVVCLGAAVWLNMKYSTFESPVGTGSDISDPVNSEYYSKEIIGEAVNTSTGVDYIATARNDRNKARTDAIESVKEIVNSSDADSAAKNDAVKRLTALADAAASEATVETVIKSKGFADALVMINGEGATVIVPSEGLLTSETLQIQDAVTSQTEISLENIKIIQVK